MKTPQQIKDEVEKEKEILDNWLTNDLDFYNTDWYKEQVIDNDTLEEYIRFRECKAQLSILTEYDKAMKEIIKHCETKDCFWNGKRLVRDFIDRQELLSKIGDGSEVEK